MGGVFLSTKGFVFVIIVLIRKSIETDSSSDSSSHHRRGNINQGSLEYINKFDKLDSTSHNQLAFLHYKEKLYFPRIFTHGLFSIYKLNLSTQNSVGNITIL